MKKIILVFFLFCNIAAFAQQDMLFTQYMFNKLLLNPAYAGSRENLNIDMVNRTQWVNIDGAPKTISISAHAAMRNRRVGLGVYAFRDALGPNINQGLMGTYSYRLNFVQSSLSFGLQFGIKYTDFDWNVIRVKFPDHVFTPQDVRNIAPDANFGVYYQSRKFFMGLSSKQLLENETGITNEGDKSSFSKLTRHFYLMSGCAIPLVDKIVFRPSILTKYTPNAPWQVDLNASVLFGDVFWVGASYRTAKALVFLTEFKITEKLHLGYSFDLYLNELQPFNYGSHEVRLRFEIPLFDATMRTPRYF